MKISALLSSNVIDFL